MPPLNSLKCVGERGKDGSFSSQRRAPAKGVRGRAPCPLGSLSRRKRGAFLRRWPRRRFACRLLGRAAAGRCRLPHGGDVGCGGAGSPPGAVAAAWEPPPLCAFTFRGRKGDPCPWRGRGCGGLRGYPSSVWSESCTGRGVAVGLASCSLPWSHHTPRAFGGTQTAPGWAGTLPALQAELLRPELGGCKGNLTLLW